MFSKKAVILPQATFADARERILGFVNNAGWLEILLVLRGEID
jgi:hypothetical protein